MVEKNTKKEDTDNKEEEFTSSVKDNISEEFSVASIENYEELMEKRKKESYKILGGKVRDEIIDNLKNYVSAETEKLKNQIKKNEKEATESKKELENKINDSKLRIIETIGIFVALFTFISVEFQIFRSGFSLKEAGGLTLIILGGMLMFISFIDFFVKMDLRLFDEVEIRKGKDNKKNKKTRTTLLLGFWIRVTFLVLCTLLVFIGVWMFSCSDRIIETDNQVPVIQIRDNTISPTVTNTEPIINTP